MLSGGLWFFAHTIPWLPAGPTSIDFKPTDNPKTLEKLRNDPLILRQPRLDMGYGLFDPMDAAASRPCACTCPTSCCTAWATAWCRRAGKSAIALMPRRPDSNLAFYKDGYHLLLRDKEAPVASDILAWIADHEAPLPSGADARVAARDRRAVGLQADRAASRPAHDHERRQAAVPLSMSVAA